MSKLGKELKRKNVNKVLDSDGRRMQCEKCRSKALEKIGNVVLCHACGNEMKD